MPTRAIHYGHARITYVNPSLSRVPIKETAPNKKRQKHFLSGASALSLCKFQKTKQTVFLRLYVHKYNSHAEFSFKKRVFRLKVC